MSLAEAIAAVRAGMAYSTAMPPAPSVRPPSMEPTGPTPTPIAGGGDDGFGARPGGGGGGNAPSVGGRIQGPGFDDSSGLYGSDAVPPGFIPVGTVNGDNSFAPYFYNGRTGEIGRYTTALNAYGDTTYGFSTLSETERKRFLDQYARATDQALPGGGGTSGALTAAQSATLGRQAEQDKWNKVVDYITALQNERQTAEASQRARTNTLLSAGPDLAAGNEYRGGFGPSGGYSIMERLQGGPGLPVATGPSIVPLDLGLPPGDPALVDRLLGPLM